MTREVSTEPRTSHRLLEAACRVSASCFIVPMVSRSCRAVLVVLDFRWVLSHSCPWLRVSRSTSSSPMGRVRWAREVIGPKLRLENERIKPFGQLTREHYVRTEWRKIRSGASPKLKLGVYVHSASF